MNRFFGYFRNILFLFGAALLFNIISWLIILTQIKPSAEQLPLRYNIFYGAIYGKGYFLYLIPLAGLIILAINYFLQRYAKNREPFISRTLAGVALVAETFILLAVLFLKSIII